MLLSKREFPGSLSLGDIPGSFHMVTGEDLNPSEAHGAQRPLWNQAYSLGGQVIPVHG